MEEKTANFRFKGYKITESTFKIASDKEIGSQLRVEFNKTDFVNEDEHKMRLDLSTTIKDDKVSLEVFVKAEGHFEFDTELSADSKEIFFKTSAPAILFPYIRAYITTLSSLSGVKPIILPTLNLSKR